MSKTGVRYRFTCNTLWCCKRCCKGVVVIFIRSLSIDVMENLMEEGTPFGTTPRRMADVVIG